MGFFKDLFGIATEEDFPNMDEFSKHLTRLFIMIKYLAMKHDNKLPYEANFLLAVVLVTACHANIPMDNYDAAPLLKYFVEKGQDGKMLIHDDNDRIIAWAGVACNYNFNSRVALARLVENMNRLRNEVYQVIDDEGGVDLFFKEDPEFVAAFNKSGLSDIIMCAKYMKYFHQEVMKMYDG